MNLLDILFPVNCLGCGKTGNYLCSSCLAKLDTPKLICSVCERPQPFGETHPKCKTEHSLDGLVYFYDYKGIIRDAIHKLKYHYITDLAIELENQIIKQLNTPQNIYGSIHRCIEMNGPTVAPVPLFWYKENRRGFNQASLFGQAIAKHFDLPFDDHILIRTKPTISQTKLSYKNRKENVEGIFCVLPSVPIPNPSILLVDDVWTTGATMKEVCKTLKKTGVKEVWGLTIAR